MVWEIPIQRQHFDPPFLKPLFLIQTPESWTYCIELSGYCCRVGEVMTRGWACKIFHLRKSEGHQLLKTQHVSWLHYHIMDYWCDCQWGNCHLCLLCDGFRPDCRTWRTVKGPSSLISRPLEEKNTQLWFEEAVLYTILQPLSTHLSAGLRLSVTVISKFLMVDYRRRPF